MFHIIVISWYCQSFKLLPIRRNKIVFHCGFNLNPWFLMKFGIFWYMINKLFLTIRNFDLKYFSDSLRMLSLSWLSFVILFSVQLWVFPPFTTGPLLTVSPCCFHSFLSASRYMQSLGTVLLFFFFRTGFIWGFPGA